MVSRNCYCRIPSTKTRIETLRNSGFFKKSIMIAEYLPLKQGLKQFPADNDFPSGIIIAEYLPLKQGLKLISFVPASELTFNCRIPSTKTRIETNFCWSFGFYPQYYCRIPSTKTRIETFSNIGR